MSAITLFFSSQAFIMVMINITSRHIYYFMNMYLTMKQFKKTHLIHVPHLKSLCIMHKIILDIHVYASYPHDCILR